MQEVRIIKKYPNRRLYDTAISRYITMEEIKELVLAHTPFKIVDVRTDSDVTNSILLQIISEEENACTPIFTTEILQNIIRFYGNPLQKMMSQALEKSFNFFANQENDSQKYFDKTLDKTQFFQVMTDLTQKNLALWQSIFNVQTPPPPSKEEEPAPPKKPRKKPEK